MDAPVPADAAKRSLKIFLVEDSVSVRERLTELLAVAGEMEVVGFADSEEASLRTFRTEPIDVAIVDLNLKKAAASA